MGTEVIHTCDGGCGKVGKKMPHPIVVKHPNFTPHQFCSWACAIFWCQTQKAKDDSTPTPAAPAAPAPAISNPQPMKAVTP